MQRPTFIKNTAITTAAVSPPPSTFATDRRVKIAIIGTGWFGTDILLPAKLTTQRFDEMALRDVNPRFSIRRISILVLLTFFWLFSQQDGFSQSCGTRQLDPRAAQFLKMVGNTNVTLEQLRKVPINLLHNGPPVRHTYPPADVQRIKVTADSIPILIFNPLHEKNLPIMIDYHGGGFTVPLVAGFEYAMWQEAKTFGVIVFAPDYRVAPENKFPTAVNDSYNAFKWVLERGTQYGGDTSRLVMKGGSAGANLAAVVAQKAKKEGISTKIKLQILSCIPADGRPEHMETSLSYQENAVGYFLTKANCYFGAECYGTKDDLSNLEASPILSENLSGLPPAVLINAEFDPLRDDGIAYAAKLRKFGVKVWDKCFAGQIHSLLGLPPDSDEMKEHDKLILTAMNECFSK